MILQPVTKEEYSKFERECEDLRNDLLLDLRELHEPLPLELYHYTGSPAFEGIIKTNCLWATSLRNMNDCSELDYAQRLAFEAIRVMKEKYRGAAFRLFFELCDDAVSALGKRFPVYGVCFCAAGDKPNQWQYYGQQGAGYTIGFQADHLEQTVWANTGSPGFSKLMLCRVCYHPLRQRQVIRVLLDKICRRVHKDVAQLSSEATQILISNFIGFLAGRIAPYIVSFKDKRFEPEQEWRLVYANVLPESNPYLKVRQGLDGNRTINYFEFVPIDGQDQLINLPITSIVQEPNCSVSEEDLKGKLIQCGYSSGVVRIRRSVQMLQ